MTSRERFEEWARDEGYFVLNDPISAEFPDYYTEENVRCMWTSWQAALASLDVEAAAAIIAEGQPDHPVVREASLRAARAILNAAKGGRA